MGQSIQDVYFSEQHSFRIRLVRAFAQEKREITRFEKRSADLRDSNRGVNLSVSAFNPLMAFLFSLGG